MHILSDRNYCPGFWPVSEHKGRPWRQPDYLNRIYILISLVSALVIRHLFSTAHLLQLSSVWSKTGRYCCRFPSALSAAILLTGIGVALTVNMRIVPNPGDGIVNAIGPVIGKDMGFSKNLFDSFCVIIKLVIGLFTSRLFYGIEPGTVIAVLATGRSYTSSISSQNTDWILWQAYDRVFFHIR